MTESTLVADIRLELGKDPDVVLWRNSTGQTDEYDARRGGSRHIRYGLAKGSADLVGIVRTVEVRLPLEGLLPRFRSLGRFIALEVKTAAGRVSVDQEQWLRLVRLYGGYGAVVRSVEEAVEAVARAKRGDP